MWNPGALIPVPEIHGNAREVTADTVADKAVLFSPGHMAKLDAACGPSQVPYNMCNPGGNPLF